MPLVKTSKDCFFGGIRAAGSKFDFDGNIEDYPYLSAVGSHPEPIAEEPEADEEDNSIARDIAIQKAVYSLDHDNDEHWTKKGDPAILYVESVCGYDTNRQEIKALCPEVRRNK